MHLLRLAALLGIPCILAAQSGPYQLRETFDAVLPPALPAGWSSTQHRTPGVNDFTTSASTPHSPPNAVLSTNATIAQELLTPVLDFRTAAPESIAFVVRRSASHAARVVVEVSTDGGASFPIGVGDTLRNAGSTSYIASRWPLPPVLAGASASVIRWRIIPDASGATGTFRLDDIVISGRRLHDLALHAARSIPAHPGEDDSVSVAIVVANTGRLPSPAFTVFLAVDADGDSLADPEELIATAPGVPELPQDDSATVLLPAGRLGAGRHPMIAGVQAAVDDDSSNNTLRFALGVGYRPGSVVINEIMYAPAGAAPEWVELLNTRDEPVDLRGWIIADNSAGGRREITPGTRSIPPGAMVVLTRDSAALRAAYPGLPPVVIGVPGFPALNNTGDAVILCDDQAACIDSTAYLPAWGGDDGRSLERLDHAWPSTDPLNWESSTDSLGATPGRTNSVVVLEEDLRVLRFPDQQADPGAEITVGLVVGNRGRQATGTFTVILFHDADGDSIAGPQELIGRSVPLPPPARRDSLAVTVILDSLPSGPYRLIAVLAYPPDMRTSNDTARATLHVSYRQGAIVVNEILAQPLAGRAEYIELTSLYPDPVPLAQWKLRGPSGSTALPLDTGGAVLPREGFLLLASDSTVFRSFPGLHEGPGRVILILGRSIGLNNEADRVVVTDPAGVVVDSVAYASSWHNPGVGDPSGRSLERIRPRGGSNDARNWSTCTSAEGGTPCAVNSIYAAAVSTGGALSASPNPFSPDGDGRDDFTVIQFRLPLPVSMIRLRLYDVRGRLIRTLANNEPAGSLGEVVWDGLDDDRRKARIGIYVVLLEAIDDRGGVLETLRGTVVLAGVL